MLRKVDDERSEFNLKNAIEYEVTLGYNIYNYYYNIDLDRLNDISWNAHVPMFSAQSDTMSFYYWNLEGCASGILSTALATVAMLAVVY